MLKKLPLLAGLLLSLTARADTFVLPPPDEDLVGRVTVAKVEEGDTLLDIARRFDLGQNEIRLANPGLSRWAPPPGAEVVIPKRFILPDAPRRGIVLNVPEMRLYYFPRPRPGELPQVVTHPVSIGRMDWSTPIGTTRVVAKVKDPVWRPPESIKKEHAEKGDPLPDVVPAGPDNPLGRYAMRLGIPGYLIHSTNKPLGIGMRVTHGCVRMYPEDIERLFPEVPVGTPVTLVNQPVKVGWLAGALYIEVHPPLEEADNSYDALLEQALALIARKTQGLKVRIDGAALRTALEERRGIPVRISRDGISPPLLTATKD
ncbi:L,D-transpeptidase ErfK/SrfK [Methylomarinovum caldicuralii]|uniref:L,D-transpeptidase ErfK/SrfK n=1 Tax=Methylomarinovum caldicuralii TaxID=438856 RepID=A0AAU9CB69_9GAMM|nr:L,D-transpeptidase family protein [Methylomarinovum caldicuralii]BCX82881.1 L,D-transpeptidase ErfK/SrfK [Methylomarinovum caldicuralii]